MPSPIGPSSRHGHSSSGRLVAESLAEMVVEEAKVAQNPHHLSLEVGKEGVEEGFQRLREVEWEVVEEGYLLTEHLPRESHVERPQWQQRPIGHRQHLTSALVTRQIQRRPPWTEMTGVLLLSSSECALSKDVSDEHSRVRCLLGVMVVGAEADHPPLSDTAPVPTSRRMDLEGVVLVVEEKADSVGYQPASCLTPPDSVHLYCPL